jgi:uncharacterized membrane protein
MSRLTKTIIKYAASYALLILVALFLGSMSESLAHVFFFLASVLFSGAIVYEIWKLSKPLEEIEYPTRNEAGNQKELDQLTRSIGKTISGRSLSPYVANRLRHILLQKISLRSGIELIEAENLLKNPKNLSELGHDRLASLVTKRRSLPRRKSERIKTLNAILDQLEETN